MNAQTEQIERVTDRIGPAVLEFCSAVTEFHAQELRDHVTRCCGLNAPASADRILRDLRRKGVVNYKVVDRRRSLYRMIRQEQQQELL